jgi:hypothetical protein
MATPSIETLQTEAHIYNPETFFSKSGDTGNDSGSILFKFIKSLRPGMDMASIMMPTFVLRPISFLEFLAVYTQPNQSLLDAAKEEDAKKRMINVATWALSTLTLTPQNGFAGIKPYNPILGEQFHCHWEHDDNTKTVLRAEQVSHHPPITAFEIRNKEHGVHYESTGEFKAKFRGNYIDSCVEGQHQLHLEKFGETYTISWATMVARGLVWGNARIEHGGNLIIACEKTGLRASINFDNSDHKLNGEITEGKTKLYKIEGALTGAITIREDKSKEKKTLIDGSQKREKYIVGDILEQPENNSRRVWHTVTHAIKTNEIDRVARAKAEVEDYQRTLTKARKEKNEVWVPAMFEDTNQKSDTGIPIYASKVEETTEPVQSLDLD